MLELRVQALSQLQLMQQKPMMKTLPAMLGHSATVSYTNEKSVSLKSNTMSIGRGRTLYADNGAPKIKPTTYSPSSEHETKGINTTKTGTGTEAGFRIIAFSGKQVQRRYKYHRPSRKWK